MHNTHLVFLTADVDCDGTSYGAHRVSVPAHRTVELCDTDALRGFLRGQDIPFAQYVGDAYEVMPIAAFLAKYPLDGFDREYFAEVGYTSGHMAARWNPWAGPDGDDSIGIPALDSRYDD